MALASNLELSLDLSPESRDREFKGRVRQGFKAFSSHFGKMVMSNIIAIIFVLPLLLIYFMYLPNLEKQAIFGMNFSGGLGIGYGVIDDTLKGIDTLYSLRQKLVLIGLTPCLMLASFGICGLYYCCRNALWNTKLNTFRTFFRGIAKSWYKFLIAFTYLGLVATGFVYTLLEILKQSAIEGTANAGLYVAIVFVGIVLLASIMFLLLYLPMCVTYKYKKKNNNGEVIEQSSVKNNIYDYRIDIKNSIIMSLIFAVQLIFISIIFAAPMGLIFAGFFKYIIYIFILTMGLSLYTVLDLAYAQFTNDTVIYTLYVEEERTRIKEAQKAAKKEAQKNKQQNNAKKGGKKRKR